MKSVFEFCTALLLIISLAKADPVGKPALKGVTIRFPPFAMTSRDDSGVNGFRGYAVDLMKLIAEEAGFTFTLTDSPDDKYGSILENGSINGMLGEVHHKRADFAVADITVTSRRADFVAFSVPFIESTLGAILKAEAVPAGATTMKDLLNATTPSSLTMFTLKNGRTEAVLQSGNSSLARAFWRRMKENADGVRTNYAGVKKVTDSPSNEAYISEISSLEFLAGQNCQQKLVVLPDDAHLGDLQYAIALQKGSAWLEPVNKAIRGLKAKGKLAELKAKYWTSPCAASQ